MWKDLTMQQRADVISMAVKAGMRDIASIRSFYDESVGSRREYNKGGYLTWKDKVNKYKHLNIDNDNTYDYEGFYNENPRRAWDLLKEDSDAHFIDKYKTVYHPTFSTESKYSGVINDKFNPQGLNGGTWSRDNHVFLMSPDGYRGPVSMDERKAYLEDAEDNGVQLREADNTLPIYDNDIWGGVLPAVTIRGNKYPDGGYLPRPITTGGAGYIPNNYGQGAIDYVRKKLYDNILPWGYNDISQRVYNAVIKNKKEEDETRDRAIRDDLFATYLQIPNSERHSIDGGKATLSKSKYKPKGATKGKPTYRFAKLTSPAEYGILAYAGQVPGGLNIQGESYLPVGKNRVIYPKDINAFSELEGLGQFTVGRGYDNKGEYISYYDSWDLGDTNSPYKDMSFGIGNPFNVYDRIYLDDYYGNPQRGSFYLPEITVEGKKKHSSGGNLFDNGGKKAVEYEPDWSDKVEPYAAGLGLAGDAVGIGAAATGVGIPIGTAIAGVANIPNLIIDGYQTVRDGIRAYKDKGESLGSALWNGGEFLLDVAGLKILSNINKAKKAGVAANQALTGVEKKATSTYRRVGTGAGRSMARQSAKRKAIYNASRDKALKESTATLAKRGVRNSQGEYFQRKLIDEMAKRGYGVSVNDAIKSGERTLRQNLATINLVSAGQNTYHVLPKDLWKSPTKSQSKVK